MVAVDTPSFPDRLAVLVERRRSQLVLGLDPDPLRLWPRALAEPEDGPRDALELRPGAPAERDASRRPASADAPSAAALTAAAVERHCALAIDAAGSECVAVKLQLASFERLGAPGWAALEKTAASARAAGLLVIADGKRGDVPTTARAYADGLLGSTAGPFGDVAGLGADAVTLNPLLGRDSLEPFVASARAAGAGCFFLVRTSNPGAAELQDVPAPDRPLYERLAAVVDSFGRDAVGDCGLSAIGAVTGATRPQLLARLRELMPTAIFLLPGVGAQGGTVDALGAAFASHRAGGLVTASRSIVDAHRERGGDPATAAASAARELRAAAWRAGG